MSHRYRASLSTGVFGAYQVNQVPIQRHKDCDDTKEEQFLIESQEKEPTQSLESFFTENEVPDISIKAIYDATKKMDAKYQLLFKPQCNYKGCCNEPEIEPNLIKGDMYICKAHRKQMAAELKRELGDNHCLDAIISKLEQFDDAQLYKEGKRMESNDYFLRSYAKMQQQKLQISKQLLTMKPSSSEYWDLIIKHKKLQQHTSLLLKVRKISNPFLAILAVVVVVAAVVCIICLLTCCCCSGSGSSASSKTKKQREEERKKREKAIKDAENALSGLDTKFFENEKLKKKCQAIYDGKKKVVDDYEQELQIIQDKVDNAIQAIDGIDAEITQLEAQLNSGSLPIDKIFELQGKIETNKENKQIEAEKKRTHEMELQNKRNAEAYQKAQREAEIARYKLKLKQEEEDRINFDRAKYRAEILARNTSSGRVAVYVVYDSRLYFSAWCKSVYSGSKDESYSTYGNWKICKFEANSIKRSYTTSCNKFCFRTSGKYTFWVHHNNGYYKYTSGDEVEVEVR